MADSWLLVLERHNALHGYCMQRDTADAEHDTNPKNH